MNRPPLMALFATALMLFLCMTDIFASESLKNPFDKNRTKVGNENLLLIGEINEHQQQEKHAEVMASEAYYLHYADADTLSELIKSSGEFLSENGSVVSEVRSNMLWLNDTPDNLNKIKAFLWHADRPAKQVRIKAHIVNVDQSSVKELGLRFGTVNQIRSRNGADQLHMDMPLSISGAGNFTVAIAKLGSNTLLDLELSALEKEGHAKMISNPELVTLNRQTASIESGQEIPYQESTLSGATNIAFKKAVLSLKVTPIVTPDDKILLNLVVNQNKVSPLVVNGMPAVSTQEVQTQVLANSGETIVLGGIYEESINSSNERVPFLSSMPVMGALFKSKASQLERRELLIFVKPEVM